VEPDLNSLSAGADPALVFDLGRSEGSSIAKHQDAMIAEALAGGAGKHCR